MAIINQYSRISHHTLSSTGATFTVPSTEDFTTGSWLTTDLALSEIGVDEGGQKIYMRVGNTIKEIGDGLTVINFTGNTSATCVTNLYLTNLYGCSPITIHDNIQYNTSTATGLFSSSIGSGNTASGNYSHAEGLSTLASSTGSHAEGANTISSANGSHAEGVLTVASGASSHAEGRLTVAGIDQGHAEGLQTLAFGNQGHAEGRESQSLGAQSHAQNYLTIASGNFSHAGGSTSVATGLSSFIHSTNSLVSGDRSVVIGGQNITGTTSDTVYVPSLNIGTAASTTTATTLSKLYTDSNNFVVEGTPLRTHTILSGATALAANTGRTPSTLYDVEVVIVFVKSSGDGVTSTANLEVDNNADGIFRTVAVSQQNANVSGVGADITFSSVDTVTKIVPRGSQYRWTTVGGTVSVMIINELVLY